MSPPVQLTCPAARKQPRTPRSAASTVAAERIIRALRRAAACAAGSRTRLDSRVGLPARSWASPEGCALVRSIRAPSGPDPAGPSARPDDDSDRPAIRPSPPRPPPRAWAANARAPPPSLNPRQAPDVRGSRGSAADPSATAGGSSATAAGRQPRGGRARRRRPPPARASPRHRAGRPARRHRRQGRRRGTRWGRGPPRPPAGGARRPRDEQAARAPPHASRIPGSFRGTPSARRRSGGQQHRQDGGVRVQRGIHADLADQAGHGPVRRGLHPGGAVLQAQVRQPGQQHAPRGRTHHLRGGGASFGGRVQQQQRRWRAVRGTGPGSRAPSPSTGPAEVTSPTVPGWGSSGTSSTARKTVVVGSSPGTAASRTARARNCAHSRVEAGHRPLTTNPRRDPPPWKGAISTRGSTSVHLPCSGSPATTDRPVTLRALGAGCAPSSLAHKAPRVPAREATPA